MAGHDSTCACFAVGWEAPSKGIKGHGEDIWGDLRSWGVDGGVDGVHWLHKIAARLRGLGGLIEGHLWVTY